MWCEVWPPDSVRSEPRREGKEGMGAWLIRPLVLIKLGGVVLGVAVLHRDAAGQDGGHVIAHHVPLLLLPLLLHLAQLEACWEEGNPGDRAKVLVTPRSPFVTGL